MNKNEKVVKSLLLIFSFLRRNSNKRYVLFEYSLTPGTHFTEKTYSDKLSYGVLVTHKEDYEYINNAVHDNLLSLEISVESKMISDRLPRNNQQVDSDDTTTNFIVGLKWIGGILLCVCLFGLIYEFYRRRTKRMKQEEEQVVQLVP